jgi:hypothetical protein
MNRRVFVVCATALLTAPWHIQGQSPQTQNHISPWEFRQVLVDLGSYLDAHKGTDLRRQFEGIPDDMLLKMHAAVPNLGELQNAVAALKKSDADIAARALAPRAAVNASMMPQAVVGSCAPNSIIDNSPGATCTPAYPDPTNSHWQTLIDDLNGINAFSPSDYNSVKSQGCGLSVELNLQRVSVTFQGLLNSLSPICSIIPAPLNAACYIPLTAVAVTDSVSQGLYSDCLEQDGLVNAAEIDAGFHNTVTIYKKLGDVSTQVSGTNTQLTNLSTQLTNATSTIDANTNTAVSTATTTIDGHTDSTVSTAATNINNNTNSDINTLTVTMNAAFNNLSSQVGAATNLLAAYLQQIMKLDMTPEGQRVLIPAILTCDGTAAHPCPKPLAACQGTGCSWNSVGPLP